MNPAISEFFGRYATALTAGDTAAIAACYEPPGMVVTDDTTTPITDRAEVAAYFTGIAERYRALGAFGAIPTIRTADRLTPTLWLVDVRWDSLDHVGEPASVDAEHYLYLLRMTAPDRPMIVLAITTDRADRLTDADT